MLCVGSFLLEKKKPVWFIFGFKDSIAPLRVNICLISFFIKMLEFHSEVVVYCLHAISYFTNIWH